MPMFPQTEEELFKFLAKQWEDYKKALDKFYRDYHKALVKSRKDWDKTLNYRKTVVKLYDLFR